MPNRPFTQTQTTTSLKHSMSSIKNTIQSIYNNGYYSLNVLLWIKCMSRNAKIKQFLRIKIIIKIKIKYKMTVVVTK